jgi:hypothetical protein
MTTTAKWLIPALLLAGCDAPNISRAKDSVREQLRDPESAQFKDVSISHTGAICGQVNARNGYGGMSGFKFFFADKDGYVARLQEDAEGADSSFWQEHSCACYTQSVREESAKFMSEPREACPGDKP